MQQQDNLIHIPFTYLAEILLSSPPPHLPSRAISRGPYELGDPYPSIVRFELGVILKSQDPKENIFTVFLYPPRHAEVWSAREWRESRVHRMGLLQSQERSQAEMFAREEAEKLYNKRLEFYMDYLASVLKMKLSDGKTSELAKKLVELEKTSDISNVFPGLKNFKPK